VLTLKFGSASQHTVQGSGHYDRFQTWRSSDRIPGGIHGSLLCPIHQAHFWVMQMACFVQNLCVYDWSSAAVTQYHWESIHNLCIPQQTVASLRYWCVCCLTIFPNFGYIFRRLIIDHILQNESFQKLLLFFENTFQYLRKICQDISVSHFDSRRSLSSANRRRSISTILFVNFTYPCDQHDRKIQKIRKSAARWRGRLARGYRKLTLRANLPCVPDIKM